ncbi:MAG TPA: hypothetical protein PLN27_15610 [Acidobacteriota bacterium]|jgi:hypothetical protein|nr:hypothetical protein [Acidobacteriota bacterium]
MTSTEKVIQKAIELVDSSPTGKRYSDLVREIAATFPDIPVNTIHGAIHKFRTDLPETLYQPNKGLYRAVRFREEGEKLQDEVTKKLKHGKIREADFYEAFGDWLINELEECTRSIPVGGNKFKDKWGTPDVVGIREARRSDIIKPPTEIVSAEIKLDPANLITAFGQACSYRLFSHKSYIVVPDNSSEDDIARLDALSRIFGIGLVIFNPLDPKNPDFRIRSRAAREEPDMFYVNKYLKLIEDDLFT